MLSLTVQIKEIQLLATYCTCSLSVQSNWQFDCQTVFKYGMHLSFSSLKLKKDSRTNELIIDSAHLQLLKKKTAGLLLCILDILGGGIKRKWKIVLEIATQKKKGHINLHIFFLAHLNHEQFLNMICISHFHLNLKKDSWTNDSAHLQLLKKLLTKKGL